jgi:tetratricopeptide (TPR) repeat protein
LFTSRDLLRPLRFAIAGLAILLALPVSSLAQSPANNSAPAAVSEGDELNSGAAAYKGARYDEAITHFQRAMELAPNDPIARLYLATAISEKIVPGSDAPENLKLAQSAIDQFLRYLDNRAHDASAMRQIAAVDYTINKLDDAKQWQKKALSEDPRDPEAAYTVGVIDWQQAYQNVRRELDAVHLQDDGEGNAHAPAKVMEAIHAQNGALVTEALEYLNRAIVNQPNYDDAMAYLNLIYRRKADLDYGNEAARKDDLTKADEWRDKAMAARKANAQK